jgi:hypothetical protein
VPPQAETPEAVMDLLSPWVDFSGFPGAPEPPKRLAGAAGGLDQDVRMGMSWAEVQVLWGAPDHLESSHEADLRRADAVYRDRGLELTFVEDVLVRIRPIDPRLR